MGCVAGALCDSAQRRPGPLLVASIPAPEVVGIAQSGTEALRCIFELRPDVVLVRQNLPERSDLEVAARVIASRPQRALDTDDGAAC